MSDRGELSLPVFILHKSTVKATFNTLFDCELLGGGGLSGQEAGVLYESLGINP